MSANPHMNPFLPELPISNVEARRIIGPKGSGKTAALVNRLAALLDSGADPREILVLAATPTAALSLKARMERLFGAGAVSAVRVTTARQFALLLLDRPEAKAATGRRARMACGFETQFLIEDMKTSGLRPKRLREMLKFMHRGWTELADEDQTWLIDEQERDVQARYRDYLAFYECLAEPEISNMALKYLRLSPDALHGARAAHVLADDYQLMSRASQLLACVLAGKTLTITADPINTAPVFDSYPYAAGPEELMRIFPDASTDELAPRCQNEHVALAVSRILGDSAFKGEERSTAPGKVEECVGDSPGEEFELVAEWVARQLDSGVPAERIYVAHPSVPAWGRSVARALSSRGIAVCEPQEPSSLGGDVRDLKSCTAARAASLLMLAADSNDSMAWRSWLGYGDWLTRSAAFDALRRHASPEGLSLAQALKSAKLEPPASPDAHAPSQHGVESLDGVGKQQAAVDEGLREIQDLLGRSAALIEKLSSLGGRDLLDMLEQAIPGSQRVVSGLLGCVDGKTAAQMGQDLLARLTAPALRAAPGCVAVAPWEYLCGLAPEALIAVGMVNGFVPTAEHFDLTAITPDKQLRQHDEYVRKLYGLIGSAPQRFAVSRFRRVRLDTAQRLRLKIDRIGLVDGEQVATIGRSDLLALLN